MSPHQTLDATSEAAQALFAIVRAGCFASEDEAIREAVQMLFAVKPQLRLEVGDASAVRDGPRKSLTIPGEEGLQVR